MDQEFLAGTALDERWRAAIAADLTGAASLLTDRRQPLADRIRAVRSQLKRGPALLRLAPDALQDTARRMIECVRAVRRALGRARDAQAAIEALDDVAKRMAGRHGTGEPTDFADCRAHLEQQAEAAAMALSPAQLDEQAATLVAAARTIAALPLKASAEAEIVERFRDDYRRTRRRRPREGARLDVSALHAFRSAVVTHRYQSELLAPDAEREAALQVLRRGLGKVQDLELLREALRSDPALAGMPAAGPLMRLARRRQRKRAATAILRASRLFAVPARRFLAGAASLAAPIG